MVVGLNSTKEEVAKTFNAAATGVKNSEAQNKATTEVATSDAETQSPCWWDTTPQGNVKGVSTDGDPKSWTEVVKKGTNKKPPAKEEKTNKTEKPAATRSRARARPSAILVNVGTDQFPELAKRIRGSVNQAITGDSVVGICQAENGGLLIEVRGDQEHIEAVRAKVARSAGSDVQVKTLQQRALVEIQDLDQWTSSDEVNHTVASAVSTG